MKKKDSEQHCDNVWKRTKCEKESFCQCFRLSDTEWVHQQSERCTNLLWQKEIVFMALVVVMVAWGRREPRRNYPDLDMAEERLFFVHI